jgi:hypothetical protein
MRPINTRYLQSVDIVSINKKINILRILSLSGKGDEEEFICWCPVAFSWNLLDRRSDLNIFRIY